MIFTEDYVLKNSDGKVWTRNGQAIIRKREIPFPGRLPENGFAAMGTFAGVRCGETTAEIKELVPAVVTDTYNIPTSWLSTALCVYSRESQFPSRTVKNIWNPTSYNVKDFYFTGVCHGEWLLHGSGTAQPYEVMPAAYIAMGNSIIKSNSDSFVSSKNFLVNTTVNNEGVIDSQGRLVRGGTWTVSATTTEPYTTQGTDICPAISVYFDSPVYPAGEMNFYNPGHIAPYGEWFISGVYV